MRAAKPSARHYIIDARTALITSYALLPRYLGYRASAPRDKEMIVFDYVITTANTTAGRRAPASIMAWPHDITPFLARHRSYHAAGARDDDARRRPREHYELLLPRDTRAER